MHAGIHLAISMWALTALSICLVVLRLYTRRRIVKFVGIEDHMYAWTGAFLLCFTVCIQVAVHYGLGQSFWSLSFAASSDAIFWTYVANSFAIIGNAMAKLSMGLFLLRVVQVRWQRIALWAAVLVTISTSVALTIMLWNQTDPVKASWDPLRTPGKWNIKIQPMSVGLGGTLPWSRRHLAKGQLADVFKCSLVQHLRLLLRHLPVVIYLVVEDAPAGEDHARQRHESRRHVSAGSADLTGAAHTRVLTLATVRELAALSGP